MRDVDVQIIGGLLIRSGDRVIFAGDNPPLDIRMLLWLALIGRPVPSAEMSELLWPETPHGVWTEDRLDVERFKLRKRLGTGMISGSQAGWCLKDSRCSDFARMLERPFVDGMIGFVPRFHKRQEPWGALAESIYQDRIRALEDARSNLQRPQRTDRDDHGDPVVRCLDSTAPQMLVEGSWRKAKRNDRVITKLARLAWAGRYGINLDQGTSAGAYKAIQRLRALYGRHAIVSGRTSYVLSPTVVSDVDLLERHLINALGEGTNDHLGMILAEIDRSDPPATAAGRRRKLSWLTAISKHWPTPEGRRRAADIIRRSRHNFIDLDCCDL